MIIGYVSKPQGIRGEVKLNLDLKFSRVKNLSSLKIDGEIYEIEKLENRTNGIFAKFKNVNDRNTAESLREKQIEAQKEDLAVLDENEFYFEDLIGCEIFDENNKFCGKVTGIEQYGAADVILVEKDGKNFSLPFLDDIFKEFKFEERKIVVDGERFRDMKVFE